MQTMFNVYEAKADFSNVLATVENQVTTVMMVMRYGKPIARHRHVSPMKKYVGKVKIVGDMFDDTSADWEAIP